MNTKADGIRPCLLAQTSANYIEHKHIAFTRENGWYLMQNKNIFKPFTLQINTADDGIRPFLQAQTSANYNEHKHIACTWKNGWYLLKNQKEYKTNTTNEY